uniref:Spermatosis associated 45 n=2 Tax=Emydidae TaxID=8476 RepID=A0A8C3FTK2_CHRPI
LCFFLSTTEIWNSAYKKDTHLDTMGDAEKKRLIELNMTRESLCMVEGKGDSTWLRPQRRHFPQSNRSSLETYREKEPELDTGRSSWTALTPLHHKERRHFPERNNAIFG